MATISIFKDYNNYYNRTIKIPAIEQESYYRAENINFNPNDHVNTSIVIGNADKAYDGQGDYVQIVDKDTTHWFIMESTRIRDGQFKLMLRRDLLRDYNAQILNSTAKIKRGIVSNSNPFIFNEEPFSVNRIKTQEIELKDDTQSAWLCGFVARDNEATLCEINTTVIPDFSVTDLSEWEYNDYRSLPLKFVEYDSSIQLGYAANYINIGYILQKSLKNFNSIQDANKNFGIDNIFQIVERDSIGDDLEQEDFLAYMQKRYESLYRVKWLTSSFSYIGEQSIQTARPTLLELQNLNGKYIKSGNATDYKTYRIQIEETIEEKTTDIIREPSSTDTSASGFFQSLLQALQSWDSNITEEQIAFYSEYNLHKVKINLVEVNEGKYSITIPTRNNRFLNKSAPFDMFCIPFSDGYKVTANEITTTTNKIFSMQIASEIARELGTKCYDVQLLPYCPMTGYTYSEEYGFNIGTADSNRYTPIISEASSTVGFIFWATASTGTLNIPYYLSTNNFKVSNQTEMYRLTSPNYNGQFEFSLAKNNGSIENFNVDYTYLPYSSYIHVNPNFKGLYGKDFNDARGLIVQGDFSIMYLSDAWVQYQINNKNYNNIFNRQIENMDVNRRYERINQVANAAAGAIGTGVGVGTLINPIAGVAAGAASAAAGAADLYISDKLYAEKKDYTRDMYEFSLENVQALPNSIAKTTAYTENNKIFPLLEIYTCTQEEKNAFVEFIVHYSMSIGVVGSPISYMFSQEEIIANVYPRGFISAELIKIDNVGEDNHVINAIANEMSKGWYQK